MTRVIRGLQQYARHRLSMTYGELATKARACTTIRADLLRRLVEEMSPA
jgi:hypothetical protein